MCLRPITNESVTERTSWVLVLFLLGAPGRSSERGVICTQTLFVNTLINFKVCSSKHLPARTAFRLGILTLNGSWCFSTQGFLVMPHSYMAALFCIAMVQGTQLTVFSRAVSLLYTAYFQSEQLTLLCQCCIDEPETLQRALETGPRDPTTSTSMLFTVCSSARTPKNCLSRSYNLLK